MACMAAWAAGVALVGGGCTPRMGRDGAFEPTGPSGPGIESVGVAPPETMGLAPETGDVARVAGRTVCEDAHDCLAECDDGLIASCAAAATLLEARCEIDAEACVPLAALLLEGRGVATDRGRALALLESTCEGADVAESCRRLARLYARGSVVARDPARAADYLQTAYEIRYAQALPDVQRVGVRQGPLLASACEEGDRLACAVLGALLLDAERAPLDEAERVLGRGCTWGETAACLMLRELRDGDELGLTPPE